MSRTSARKKRRARLGIRRHSVFRVGALAVSARSPRSDPHDLRGRRLGRSLALLRVRDRRGAARSSPVAGAAAQRGSAAGALKACVRAVALCSATAARMCTICFVSGRGLAQGVEMHLSQVPHVGSPPALPSPRNQCVCCFRLHRQRMIMTKADVATMALWTNTGERNDATKSDETLRGEC